ncbi:DUF4350 domain-containing protein [Polaribacter porphyrae]|uniref:DUF4350 domain-containing protein n=1 Tax=Polaribacter porphyrae TaxID=1137780 RepID=A0A2S7WL72_9FLAO|nr:DUF4350 domain-containing protein [Polaribacter porphyrae]PQJ78348.1 hypothetical protein BTO18_03705 [Polaribacter porphyrae]
MFKLHIHKLVTLFVVFLLLTSCKKTNWSENYREREKSPFGTYIVYNEAKNLFESEEVILLKQNFYDYLFENYDTTTPNFGNYICIKNDAYWLSEDAIKELLSFVADGNTAFISLNYFNKSLKKQLEFTTNNLDKDVFGITKLRELEGTFKFTNEELYNSTYKFDRNIRRNYFLQYNENKTIVLGNAIVGGEDVPNFIKIYHGKGAVYLHSNPVVFTNYYLLNDKESYTEKVFSYLPSSTILWDPQIKRSKYSNQSEKENSVFKFFLQHPTLKWFLFVTIVGVLLFMLFNARRKQRAIPIIDPLENTTVAFTQTIASLYLKEQNHKNLVDKKISYFLEKIRTKYLLNTNNLNKEFIKNLAAKSGNNLQNTKYLVNTIITLNKRSKCSEEELFVLHKMIEKFLKNK